MYIQTWFLSLIKIFPVVDEVFCLQTAWAPTVNTKVLARSPLQDCRRLH